MFCSNCGAQVNEGAKFCSACGQTISAPARQQLSKPPAVLVADINNALKDRGAQKKPAGNACPHCRQIDTVRKVSAVIERDTHETTGTMKQVTYDEKGVEHTHTVPINTTDMTATAKKLLPPSKPENGVSCFWNVIGLVPGWDLVFLPFSPLARKAKITIFLIMGAVLASFIILYKGPSEGQILLILMPLAAIAVVACLIIYYMSLRAVSKEREKKLKEELLPAWYFAMEKWERLYYCERDDLVFDPTNGTSAPANNMMSFLNK